MAEFVSVFSPHRLGVIEEEKEEDERRLGVAVAAAERMSVLVRTHNPEGKQSLL